jgi:DNA-binding LacI/PurR family transcriptional regulator
MGQVAADTMLKLICDKMPHPASSSIMVYPQLVVRKSTGRSPK